MTAAGRTCRRLLCLAVALACSAPLHAQTSAAPVNIPFVYSTTPMTRNGDLMLAASILSTSASEAGLAKLSPSLFRSPRAAGRAARTAKLLLFDVPMVTYFVGLNHEWGHQVSAAEYGVESHLSFTGTPWSGRPFDLIGGAVPIEPPAIAVIHGGGLEASRRLKDLGETIMLGADRVGPGLALAAIIGSLDTPLYAFRDLSPSRFATPGIQGDVVTLVDDWGRRLGRDSSGFEQVRHQVRTRMVLNLLDPALWSETIALMTDHVWNGEPTVRVRWLKLGDVQVIPSLRYEFSPFGPEYYVGTHFRAFGATGTMYGRWTERIGGDRLIGGGMSLSHRSMGSAVPGGFKVKPRLTIDAWSHAVGGSGIHGEIEAQIDGWPGRRAALTTAAGAKSSGHLVGYSLDRGAYVTAGVIVRVW